MGLVEKLKGKIPWGTHRSPQWPRVRKEFLKGKVCAVCGGKEKLEAHHIVPFHVKPELELEPSNLLPLCEAKRFGVNCHQLTGHHGCWSKVNPHCREDAALIGIWIR